MFRRALVALVAVIGLLAPTRAGAQPVTQLKSTAFRGTIAANGEAVTLAGVGGLASLTIQTLDSYSGTWEAQCSTDVGVTFDADDEVLLTLMGSTTTATTVTDVVGIWQANISGCTDVRVIATAGFAASDTTFRLVAITPGGGSSGGAGGGGGGEVTNAGTFAVQCTSGCAGGTTDADDASIAAAQSTGLSLALNQAFDGTVWRRVTFGTAGTASAQVTTVQGIASMTPLLVTATATNLDVQIGGSDTLTVASHAVTNAGTFAAQVTNPTPATATSYLTARISDGTSFATLATDATHDSAASATGPQIMGVAAATGALPTAVTAGDAVRHAMTLSGVGYVRTPDPCSDEALKVYYVVDIVTATTTEIVNQSASNFFRICSYDLTTAAANNVAIVEDDTDACASPTAGLNGGVTAGEGWVFGSNGGKSNGNGNASIMRTSVVNRYVCIITSAAVQLSGTIVYTLAP